MIILIIWAIRPLYTFIFPLGHKHGEGAHTHAFEGEVIPNGQHGHGSDEKASKAASDKV